MGFKIILKVTKNLVFKKPQGGQIDPFLSHFSVNKTFFLKKSVNKSSIHSSGWKDKSFLSKLAKVDFKRGYSISGKGLHDTIYQVTFSTKKFQVLHE